MERDQTVDRQEVERELTQRVEQLVGSERVAALQPVVAATAEALWEVLRCRLALTDEEPE
ncbi:MAG: hypothetical protein HYY04_14350 [Chloroflexi bacterium]|nr:hypothetical protein [Chloroflexota bacterium]